MNKRTADEKHFKNYSLEKPGEKKDEEKDKHLKMKRLNLCTEKTDISFFQNKRNVIVLVHHIPLYLE